MTAVGWVPAVIVGLLAVATGYHTARLAGALRRRHRRAGLELAHTLMGVTMAGMMLVAFPRPLSVWLVAGFAALAALLTVIAVRQYVIDGTGLGGRHAVLAIGCAAMAWMLVPSSGLTALPGDAAAVMGSAMPGMAMPAGGPVTGSGGRLITAVLLVAVAVAAADAVRRSLPGHGARRLRALPAGCQVAMGTATAYMLLGLL